MSDDQKKLKQELYKARIAAERNDDRAVKRHLDNAENLEKEIKKKGNRKEGN